MKWNGLLGLVAAVAVSGVAEARAFIATPGAQRVPDVEVSPMLGISSFYGVEAGAKMGWKISDPGFVPQINNSVYIEGSAFVAEKGYLFLAPLLLWEFHLHQEWSVYGEAGAEAGIKFGSSKSHDDDWDTSFRPHGRPSGLSLGAGGIYRFKPDMALRLESEFTTSALRVGLMFAI
jgi:hypothetical protein